MKHSVKPSRGPDSTRSFSGSSGERRAKPFVLTTRGRASPSVSTSVSPYRKAASALSMSVSTRQSSACKMRPASSSAEARRLSDSRTGRTRLSLMVNESTMPSKKNIAQCRPFRPVASRTMNVSSPSNTDCMSAMLCARFSVNVIFCIKSPRKQSFRGGGFLCVCHLIREHIREQAHGGERLGQRVAGRADLDEQRAGACVLVEALRAQVDRPHE